ncbi:MAG: nitroreductase, partial [Myxococcales bacterium]|nr:nitroreductase [Myxococcales bacterium]
MIEPAPDETTLSLAFEAALRAPDHGQLRPYRFFLVRGQARHALGGLDGQTLGRSDPTAGPEQLTKMRQKPLRAPLIVVVAARLVDHPKVPRIEQVVCAGAAGQNILLCLHARGYAGIWRTGGAAYSDSIKA